MAGSSFPAATVRALLANALGVPATPDRMVAAVTQAWDRERATVKTRRAPVRRKGYSRTYARAGSYHAKRGTWTHYMVECICAHNDTASAENAHFASGEYADKRLDWTWAVKVGLITFNT